MRPSGKRAGGPISAKYLSRVLRDRYYLGILTYNGQEYPGRHNPLVTTDLFNRVQTVLDVRAAKTGQRERRHDHYLKSTVWCARCHDRGVDSRLLLVRGKGRGGEYFYYLCSAHLSHQCKAGYFRVADVEAAVIRHYATLQLPADISDRVRRVLQATLSDEVRAAHLLHAQLTKRAADLDARETNLLDLVEGGGAAAQKVRRRLKAIADERARVRGELEAERPQLEASAALIRVALELLDDPQKLYRDTTDPVRRQLNQIFYTKLYLDTADDAVAVVGDDLAEPFAGLTYEHVSRRHQAVHHRNKPTYKAKSTHQPSALKNGFNCASLLERIARDEGSSKETMVELWGFEPQTPSMRTRCATRLRHSPLTVPKATSRPEQPGHPAGG
jgi:site-specific DNA recombinase